MKHATKQRRPYRSRIFQLFVVGVIAGGAGYTFLGDTFARCSFDPHTDQQVCYPDPPVRDGDPLPPSPAQQRSPDPYNPPLSQSCKNGFDVAFLVDTSVSTQGGPLEKERAAIRSFITATKGNPMMYATARMDKIEEISPFTASATKAIADMNTVTATRGASILGDMTRIRDPRPDRQNLFIILTDARIGFDDSSSPNYNQVKANGTRLLGVLVPDNSGDWDVETGLSILKLIVIGNKAPMDYAGPRRAVDGFNEAAWMAKITKYYDNHIDTGSIWTSDIITTDFDKIGRDMAKAGQQLCQNSGGGAGNGGTGVGTGSRGVGAGESGSGTGKHGSGKGEVGKGTGETGAGASSGTSAIKPADKPKPIPKPSPQGLKDQKKETTPSPFFDGKEYQPGSDADGYSVDSIKKARQRAVTSWAVPLILVAVAVAVLAGFGYWWWRKRQRKQGASRRR